MSRRGSVLILFLWVLLFLGLLAMSLAVRTRLAVKIESHETKQFRMRYDYLSAVNLARYFIDSDEKPQVDSPVDAWYGVPPDFNAMEYSERFELEITDEESKLNLNKAPEQLLVEFFEILKQHDVPLRTDPKDLAGAILLWRGGSSRHVTSIGRSKFKRSPLESLEELHLLPDIERTDIDLFEPYVTVFGAETTAPLSVNLNTVHPYILEALIFSMSSGTVTKRELWRKLESAYREVKSDRDAPTVFQHSDLAASAFIQKLGLSTSPVMNQLVNQFLRYVTVDSQFFSVSVRSKQIGKATSRLDVVLGPRAIDPGNRNALARAGHRIATVPLEVLSWREGI